ncbi:GIY-YIG nuclease family protein [Streptomyces sp. W4I9-2]|uniref:GIY-YIG nuclease family protein n=1 Tax=Streptomyces sp. W4I9-2 TaxID=3042297 RepID=UPI00278AC517|nr:GIY-YIG nuclease family protein [Streptomyces sp. W4I9-2]MDQ0694221.1 hypothetical protein [Streptomyces sp. W4I9-2]
MGQGKPYIPEHERRSRERDGKIRLPYRHLLDVEDPHYYAISVHLEKMRRAGIPIDQAAADSATKLIHWEAERREQAQREREQVPIVAQANWRTPKPHVGLAVGIVYYALRQGHIKIGTTVKPLQRFADLMPDAVLAAEPGGVQLERQRHREYREFRSPTAGGEYFQPHPALIEHIRTLRETLGVPTYPFRSMLSPEESAALVSDLLDPPDF